MRTCSCACPKLCVSIILVIMLSWAGESWFNIELNGDTYWEQKVIFIEPGCKR
ncbi:hypothetical protein KP509_24G061000 [Ceratopteris richardii]|uniref:Uncharacterized protein n=1 Tax=Ceratopteris richardii TaxID=49495 RepID=A0A8T2RXT5_CERRI|nr:hypothetical protein KP509_24G061000 [Ceratopteris richardii]